MSTQAGCALLDHARAMGAAAEALALVASGSSQGVDGSVTVSASDLAAVYLLPPALEALHIAAPAVTVDVVVTEALSDLRRREADIAVRHVRPTDPELIGRVLRSVPAGFYATQAWVQRHGRPRAEQEARGLDFVGVDLGDRYIEHLRAQGLPVEPSQVRVRCENISVAWRMAHGAAGAWHWRHAG